MCRSLAGEMRTRLGVRALTSAQSSSVMSAPASCAIAVRCSTVLELPPNAMSSVIALRTASGVMIWRAVTPSSSSSMTRMPAFLASRIRSE